MHIKKIVYRWGLFIVGVLYVGLFAVATFLPLPFSSTVSVPLITVTSDVSTPVIPETRVALPVHLTIPSIRVDAMVEHVGLTPDGAMGVPTTPARVAWFNQSTHPGEIGSAIIGGHFGRWKKGKGSVFDDLNRLQKGDTVLIKDEDGITIEFVVRERQTYEADAIAPEVFSSTDGKAHLNLITCEGGWDNIKQRYSGRLVLFTDRK